MADIHITNIAELLSFANGEDGYGTSSEYLNVYLDNDLDFALDAGGAYSSTNFEGCIGNFYVNFYGQNHTIKNISYSGTATWGFFQGGTERSSFNMYDLILKDINITTSGEAGALIGSMTGGPLNDSRTFTIQNCKASGSISASVAGGLIGRHQSGGSLIIKECAFSGLVTGKTEASGLVGSHRRTNNYEDGRCYIYTSGVRAGILVINGRACGLLGSNDRGGYGGTGAGAEIKKCYFVGSFLGTENTAIYGITYNTLNRTFAENYAVIKKANTSVEMSDTANIYDNDVAADAGYTVSGGTPETTAHLKDASYMRDTYNWSA